MFASPNSSLLTLTQFYRALMEWSTDLHLVSLLQNYLVPHPRVTSLVRAQLTTVNESYDIQVALRRVTNRLRKVDSPYDALLNHTCLNWGNERLVDRVSSALPSAMFDLMLGNEVTSQLLNKYTDVHSVRRRIQKFVELLPGNVQLWWDGVTEDAVPHGHWVSKSLAQDPDFKALLESWLNDNQALQTWLCQYEKTMLLVNNSNLPTSRRVFSEEVAIEVMKFGKVGISQRMVRDLTHNCFQVQAILFNKRRTHLFADKPTEFKEECAALGLFETRLPRFSQFFFYDFTDWELPLGQSESGGAVSRRAAEAYLRSGVRLESSCGMSDIWYNYVESNAKLFKPTSSTAIPPGTSVLSCPPIFSPSQSSPHPRLNSEQLQSIRKNLDWYTAHSRPHPTKKPARVPENALNVHAEGSPPINTTLEFSTALEYYNKLLAEANSCDSKAKEQVIGHT